MFGVLTVLLTKVQRSQAIKLALLGALAVIIGAILFSITQGVSIGTGLYWAITTATTVGYGDVTPHNAIGRAIASATMLTAIPLLASAFAVFSAAVAATRLRRLLGMEEHRLEPGFVAIYGSHPAVPRIVADLLAAGRKVVVVSEADPSTLAPTAHVITGDPTNEEFVRRSHPERASQVLIASDDDGEVLVTTILVRHLAKDVPVTAVAQSSKVANAMRDLGIPRIISTEELLGHTLAKSLEAPHAADLLRRLVDSDGYQLSEVAIQPAWVGQPLSAVRAAHTGLVLGLVQGDEVTVGVAHDPVLTADDRLLVLAADRLAARRV